MEKSIDILERKLAKLSNVIVNCLIIGLWYFEKWKFLLIN